jgi:hypothetical protein
LWRQAQSQSRPEAEAEGGAEVALSIKGQAESGACSHRETSCPGENQSEGQTQSFAPIGKAA